MFHHGSRGPAPPPADASPVAAVSAVRPLANINGRCVQTIQGGGGTCGCVCFSSEALMGMRHWILSEAEQGGCHHGVACLGPLKGSRRLSAAPKGKSRESMSLATWIRCVTVRLSIRSAPSLHAPPANRNATPPSSPQQTVATAKQTRKVHAVRYTTAVLSSSRRVCMCVDSPTPLAVSAVH